MVLGLFVGAAQPSLAEGFAVATGNGEAPPAAAASGADAPRLLEKWIASLEGTSRRIVEFVADADSEFVAFGALVHDCLVRARRLARVAVEAVDLGSGTAVQQALRQLPEHIAALEKQTGANCEMVEKMGCRSQNAVEALQQIASSRGDFQRSARSLRNLGIATLMESARLGADGSGFATVAEEVQKLGALVADRFATVHDRSKGLEDELSMALASVLTTQTAQQEGLAQALSRLRAGSDHLRRVNGLACDASAALARRSEELSTSVAGIVSALQFQDITRQRFEHAHESLGVLLRELRQVRPAAEEIPGWGSMATAAALVGTVTSMQITQIRGAEEEFAAALADIRQRSVDVASGVGSMWSEVAEFDTVGDGERAPTLEQLAANLAAVVELVQEMTERNRRIFAALTASARTAGEITGHVVDIDEIGEELDLVAVNAITRSSRAGGQARPLAIIARQIQRESAEARRTTTRVSGSLRVVGAVARELEGMSESFAAAAQQEAAEPLAELQHLVATVQQVERRIEDLRADLRAEAGHLGETLATVSEGVQRQEQVQDMVAEVTRCLAAIAEEAAALVPAGVDGEPSLVLEELASHYTMESQREIHRMLADEVPRGPPARVPGKAPHGGDAMDLGDNVELF